MIISFREKLLTKELRNLRLLNVVTSVFVTLLGFIFEFAYHDGYILITGLVVSMILLSNYFLSYYSSYYKQHLLSITHGSIIILHLWAAYVAYERNFEIEILLPVSISTFTFSLLYDKFYKSLFFIFVIATFLLFLMVLKDEWQPQYTITLIALFSGAFLSEEILKRKSEYNNEIKEQEKRYLALVENMNDGLIYVDSEQLVILVNDRFCDITGYLKDDITGLSLSNFAHTFHSDPATSSSLIDLMNDGLAFRKETELNKANGNVVQVRLTASPSLDSNHISNGLLLVYTDITDLKKTEEQLKKREEGYRTFIDQSAIGIWRAEYVEPISIHLPIKEQIERLLDTGIISECNDFMAQMYGHSHASELIGRRIRDFLLIENKLDQEKINELMTSFINNNYRISNAESKEMDNVGRVRFMLNNNIGIVENEKLIRTWGVQTDITDRKRTEHELTETNQELDTFFYKASHDLKGPLASVMGIVNLARLEKTDPLTGKYFDMIETSVQRLDRTLLDLIELARTRKGSAKKSVIPFEMMINEITSSLKHLTGFKAIEFILEIEEDLQIHADKVLLLSVFQNLIHNAINYSGVQKPQIKITAFKKDPLYEFTVADNGHGIPEKIKDKVFGMFYRGHPDSSGSGLGLFIVKNALEKMHGHIRFESIENRGTTFYVTIPESKNDPS